MIYKCEIEEIKRGGRKQGWKETEKSKSFNKFITDRQGKASLHKYLENQRTEQCLLRIQYIRIFFHLLPYHCSAAKQQQVVEKSSDRRGSRQNVRESLQSSHVVQSQVQLLAQSLALQLLSIHFIWRGTNIYTHRETHAHTKDEAYMETE